LKRRDDITFILFAFNEEKRIERAVRNFRSSGKVLVVDNYSTDRTVELARALGADVLMHKNPGWGEDEGTVAIVKAAVTTEWLYWGYTDELIELPTIEAIGGAIDSRTCDIVSLSRKNYYYGAFCHDAYESRLNRVFKRNAIDFTGNVIHRFGRPIVPESRIVHLDRGKYFVHHFISNTAKSYLRVLDGYTDIEAERIRPKGALHVTAGAAMDFLKNFVLRGGYRAGVCGFYLVMQMCYYRFLVGMKRFELDEALDYASIEAKNNINRDRILQRIEAAMGNTERKT
jgi:glycosyltransferase involved in cell wall biosynthesis